MKNFYLLSFLLSFMIHFSSQAQHDLELKSFYISQAPGGKVPPGFVTTVRYTIKNDGSATIPAGSTFTRTVSRGTTPLIGPNPITLGAALAAGDSVTFTANGLYGFTEVAFENICVSAVLDSLNDNDSTNNFKCKQIQISSAVSEDIAVYATTIDGPNDLDSFDLYGGQETAPDIDGFSLQLINKGDINYMTSESFAIDVFIGNDVINNVSATPNGLSAGDTSGVLSTTESTIIPETPQEVGIYDFCIAYIGGDDNANNDTSCTSFTLIDTYVPPPPIGIEDGPQSLVNVYAHNNVIMVKDVAQPLEISVIDAQGRVVHESLIESDRNIQLETAAGVYVVRTRNVTDGKSTMQKVILQ